MSKREDKNCVWVNCYFYGFYFPLVEYEQYVMSKKMINFNGKKKNDESIGKKNIDKNSESLQSIPNIYSSNMKRSLTSTHLLDSSGLGML